MFIGPQSLTFNNHAARLAQRLKESGKSLSQIWKATGTLCGPGRTKWQELDDSRSRFNISHVVRKGKTSPSGARLQPWIARANFGHAFNVPLPDVLEYDKLYTAYPFLRKMRISMVIGTNLPIDYYGGTLIHKTDKDKKLTIYKPFRIIARTPEQAHNYLFHEIQHYIWDRAGLTPGATITPYVTFKESAGPGEAIFSPDTKAARTPYIKDQLFPTERQGEWGPTDQLSAESIMLKIGALQDALAGERDPDKRAEIQSRIESERTNILDDVSITSDDYDNAGAERQARQVQERINMSAQERRRTCPIPDNAPLIDLRCMTFAEACNELYRRACIDDDARKRWAEPQILGEDLVAIREHEQVVIVQYKGEDAFRIELYSDIADVFAILETLNTYTIKDDPTPFGLLSKADQQKIWGVVSHFIKTRFNVGLAANDMNTFGSENLLKWWRDIDPVMVLGNALAYGDEIRDYVARTYGPEYKVCISGKFEANMLEIYHPDNEDDARCIYVSDIPEITTQFPDLETDLTQMYGDPNMPEGLDPFVWEHRDAAVMKLGL